MASPSTGKCISRWVVATRARALQQAPAERVKRRWWCTLYNVHDRSTARRTARKRRASVDRTAIRPSANEFRWTGVKCVFDGAVISPELFHRRLIGNVDERPLRFHAYRIPPLESRFIYVHVNVVVVFLVSPFFFPLEILSFRFVFRSEHSLRIFFSRIRRIIFRFLIRL